MNDTINESKLTKHFFPKVAIIILNWNGWKDTIECLESVFRIDYPNYQVIVIGNGSSDNSVERIKAWAEKEHEARINSKNFLYLLTHPYVQKLIPYIEHDKKTAEAEGLLKKGKVLWNKFLSNVTYPLVLTQKAANMIFQACMMLVKHIYLANVEKSFHLLKW